MARVYLDWNATAPLRPEAREAMIAVMDAVGNPSSVHGEGREAKSILETARSDIGELLGSERADIVFAGSATEAIAMAIPESGSALGAKIDHDAVYAHLRDDVTLGVDQHGRYDTDFEAFPEDCQMVCLQSANSETGIMQDTLGIAPKIWASANKPTILVDAVQAIAKTGLRVDKMGGDYVIASPHKFGGPKGVGVLYLKPGLDTRRLYAGGGQEEGRRAGTENLVGVAGAGAAAKAAKQDRDNGVWEAVQELRDWLEAELLSNASDVVLFGQETVRIPNTSAFGVAGWKGETQVMQMDLAGYAISAGSACSSGKVKQSRVISAMGYGADLAQSTIRVSIGPNTTKSELEGFVQSWTKAYRNYKAKAA